MGRKKCSQRGKPFGRNMLIAEWIYRATGHKRERKQVSSHIQVLDRFLAGISEWDRLIKPCDDNDSGPAEGHKFYHNSIEHMVNEQKARNRAGKHSEATWDDDLEDPDGSFVFGTSPSASDLSHPVERLNFEMWVSSPVDQERALHCYTGLKSTKLTSMPLEELASWRLSFPHLTSLVDQGKRLKNCDLILLNASFKLMEDFPPRHSKLGIGLELKFPDPLWANHHLDADFEKWSCITYMYRDGVLISEPAREECQVPEHWKVRPFFQSKWWASTFTSLTEARKVAEDSKNPEAIEIANEQSCDFFRGLSIMQEISAVCCLNASNFGYDMKREVRKRMAILLWKFSQAPTDSAGTTTWQNLIAPPDRVTTNSPPPPGTEMDLPPLSMDSIVSPGVGSFDGNNHFLSQNGMLYDVYPDAMAEELCHDGFVGLKPEQIHDFGHFQSSFDLPTTQGYSIVDPSMHEIFQLPQSNLPETTDNHHVISGNLFEPSQSQPNIQPGLTTHLLEDSQSPGAHHAQDLPLSRFDVTTHQVLQEQLNVEGNCQSAHSLPVKSEHSPPLSSNVPGHTWSQQLEEDERMLQYLAARQQNKLPSTQAQSQVPPAWPLRVEDEQEEALRNALLAASAMNDLGAGAHQPPHTLRSQHRFGASDDHEQQRNDNPHWVSPLSFRPPLHSYHSFPSMRSGGSSDFPPLAGHHGQYDFAAEHHGNDLSPLRPLHQLGGGDHFIDHQLSAVSAPEDFLHASEGADGIARGQGRAHSEPDPNSAAAMESFSEDQHVAMTDTAIDAHLEAHSQPSSLVPDDLNPGEVSSRCRWRMCNCEFLRDFVRRIALRGPG